MQIRERLVRTQRRYLLLTVSGMLVWGALILGAFKVTQNEPPTWFFVVAVPVFALIALGVVGFNFFVRCPSCRGNLGRIGPLSARPLFGRRSVANCPYCGINLDTRIAP